MRGDKDRLERKIVFFMQRHKKVTMPKLALELEVDDTPFELQIHGKQHRISQAIERLRRRDLIKDVAERCPTCTRAKRNRKSIVLELTVLGWQFGPTTALPRQRSLREMTDILNGGPA